MKRLTIVFLLILSINVNGQISKVQRFLNASSLSQKEKLMSDLLTELETSEDTKFQVLTFMAFGKFERERGNYFESKKYLQNGFDLLNKSENPTFYYQVIGDGVTALDIYDELAAIEIELGNYKVAEEYYNQSLELRNKYFGRRHPTKAKSLIGLGYLSYSEARFEESEKLINEAIDLLLYSDQPLMHGMALFADGYKYLAKTYLAKGEQKKAEKSAKLAIQCVQVSRDRLRWAYSYIELSDIYRLSGQYSKARKTLERGEKIYSKYYSRKMYTYVPFLRSKAVLEWRIGNHQSAISLVDTLIEANSSFIKANFIALTEGEKKRLYDLTNRDLNLFYEFNLKTFKKNGDKSILEKILQKRIETKGFLFNDQVVLKRSVLNSNDPTILTVYKDLIRTKQTYAFEVLNGNLSVQDSLLNEINTQERFLSQKLPLAKKPEAVSLAMVKQSLGADELALEVISFKEMSDSINYLFIGIGRSKIFGSYDLLGSNEERDLLNLYRNGIIYNRPSDKLYHRFFKEMENDIPQKAIILFSPDGILSLVNLGTLSGDKLLGNRILNITSLRDLVGDVSSSSKSTAYLIGRPAYKGKPYKSDYPNILENEERSFSSMQLANLKKTEFTDLPGTQAEVENISLLLAQTDWQVKTLVGNEASESAIKQIESPTILHIATHGFFASGKGANNQAIDPMLRSGLVLAGVNTEILQGDDGVLTAFEASSLNLEGTKLVVLSACETGLGEISEGEGVYGLQRAFALAGASNIIMSLWKVDDAATKELMTAFYEFYSGGNYSIVESFAQAQSRLRDKYPNPKEWGAFVIIQAKRDKN